MVALAIVVLFGWSYASSGTTPPPAVRFEVLPPAGVNLRPSPVASAAQLALSPDGRHLAFIAATKGGPSQVWVRPLDSVQAHPLAGTEGASFPFWSHDGRFIAFFAAGKLKTVDTRGGTPQTLADAAAGRGGTWSGDDVILFSAQPSSPISRISASGGTVTSVTTFAPAQGILTQYWPQFLPDGRHFLYYQRSTKAEHQGTYVTALDPSQSARVLETGGRAVYAAGHLLFVRDGILFAQAFDDRALRTSGEPIRVADGVGYWAASFAYTAVTGSSSGVLAHGPNVVFTTSLRWHDRGRRDNRTTFRSAGVRIAAPVARSDECHSGRHRCHDRAARSPAADAGPWHNLTRNVRPVERLVSCVVARRQPHFLRVVAVGLDHDFQKAGVSPEEVFADSV